MTVFFTVLTVLTVLVVLVALLYVFPHIRICGNSMYPTYKDGERMICFRFYPIRRLKAGDVIVFLQDLDEDNKRAVIKRIDRVKTVGHSTYFYVLGDNPPESLDSREYGYIHQSKFICRPFQQRRKEV